MVLEGAVAGAVTGTLVARTADEVLPPSPDNTPSNGASEPSIVTIDLVTADAEIEYRVPAGCKKFMIQMRDGTTFKVATVKNGTLTINANYFTIRTDGVIWWDNLAITDSREAVLYLACGNANKVVEIWQWS